MEGMPELAEDEEVASDDVPNWAEDLWDKEMAKVDESDEIKEALKYYETEAKEREAKEAQARAEQEKQREEEKAEDEAEEAAEKEAEQKAGKKGKGDKGKPKPKEEM